MATSKTLTPTNVTIQIPEFTDQPDQRVNSNCIDKEADAINALNSNLTSLSDHIVNKDNITVLTGTTGNTVGTVTEVALPSGYTASNTVVIGLQYDDNGTWRTFGSLNNTYPCTVSVTILSNNKVNVITRESSGTSRSFKVTVFRYTT